MPILYGGSIFYKNDIVFENNQFDMESAHPVLVLFTTNVDEENAYILPMTSDKNRAKDNKNIYTPIMYNKKSFLNLSQIIKIPNILKNKYELVNISEYERILKEFYEYQTNQECNSKFNEIKDRIEIVLNMLEFSKENDKVKDFFVNNTYLQIYLANNNVMTDNTRKQVIQAIVQRLEAQENFVSDQKLQEALLMEFDEFTTYIQNNSYLESNNLLNSDSKEYKKFQQYYNRLQAKYSIVNVYQLLLGEVAMSYRDDTSQSKMLKLKNIEQFVEMEMKIKEKEIAEKRKRDEKKEINKKMKSEKNLKKKQEEIIKKRKKNERLKKKKLEEKYGKFYDF